MINILFVGDVFANTGKWILSQVLPKIREEHKIDLCIANGENIAGGKGITVNLFSKLRTFGVDVITSGNHIWDNPDVNSIIDSEARLLRPLNYPSGNAGRGSTVIALPNGYEVGVVSLQGRIFMQPIDCPFTVGLREIEKLRAKTPIIIVDIHAEATSEKMGLGWYLDGKVSAVIGTHTHVQTADERILPGGTAYISDAGMTGPHDSVIGMKKELVIKRLVLQSYVRFEPADKGPVFEGVFVRVDENTGKAIEIRRIRQEVKGE